MKKSFYFLFFILFSVFILIPEREVNALGCGTGWEVLCVCGGEQKGNCANGSYNADVDCVYHCKSSAFTQENCKTYCAGSGADLLYSYVVLPSSYSEQSRAVQERIINDVLFIGGMQAFIKTADSSTDTTAQKESIKLTLDSYSQAVKELEALGATVSSSAKSSASPAAKPADKKATATGKSASTLPAVPISQPSLATPSTAIEKCKPKEESTGIWESLDWCHQCGKCEINDFLAIGINVAKFILGIVGSLAFLMFVYGGFMMLISAGSPERVTTGRKILTNAVIGLVVVLVCWLLVSFIFKLMGLGFTGKFTPKEALPKTTTQTLEEESRAEFGSMGY